MEKENNKRILLGWKEKLFFVGIYIYVLFKNGMVERRGEERRGEERRGEERRGERRGEETNPFIHLVRTFIYPLHTL